MKLDFRNSGTKYQFKQNKLKWLDISSLEITTLKDLEGRLNDNTTTCSYQYGTSKVVISQFISNVSASLSRNETIITTPSQLTQEQQQQTKRKTTTTSNTSTTKKPENNSDLEFSDCNDSTRDFTESTIIQLEEMLEPATSNLQEMSTIHSKEIAEMENKHNNEMDFFIAAHASEMAKLNGVTGTLKEQNATLFNALHDLRAETEDMFNALNELRAEKNETGVIVAMKDILLEAWEEVIGISNQF